jgi:hypothetical protein
LFFVDASTDRVGIGSNAPAARLHISNSYSAATGIDSNIFQIISNNGTGGGYAGLGILGQTLGGSFIHFGDTDNAAIGGIGYFHNGDYLNFTTNGSEKCRIDSSGRLLVGTSTATNNLRLQQNFGVVYAGTANPSGMSLTGYQGTTNFHRPIIDFNRSRGTTNGSMTVVASGDGLGSLIFRGSDGSQFVDAAIIEAVVDGTPGANDMPGRLVFSTTADGASTPTERMRIDNAGNVYLKVMQVGGTANVHWSSSAGQLFVTSSSERFKHDIVDYDKGLDELMQMQPKYFVYNDEPNQKQRAGFIAEDFHALGLTEYVEYWNDDEGNATVPSEIGYANMVAILVKSIQQQQAMIAELQAKVAALEGV